MKIIFLIAILFLLVGCAQIAPQVTKFDMQNYNTNKQFAKDSLKTWSFNSGFITCAGLSNKVIFPIKSADEVRAILANPNITLGLAELDQIAKDLKDETGQPYWKDEDERLGCTLGIKARVSVMSAVSIGKLFPTLQPYLSLIFP